MSSNSTEKIITTEKLLIINSNSKDGFKIKLEKPDENQFEKRNLENTYGYNDYGRGEDSFYGY